MSKGRAIPSQQVRLSNPKRATLPVCDLTLKDGRVLKYSHLGPPQNAGPNGENIRIGYWICSDGMLVSASMDRTHHGRLLHVALSYPDHYPSWEDIKAVRYAFYPATVDVAMMLPQDKDYINIHEYCMQMWQTPVEWGLQ